MPEHILSISEAQKEFAHLPVQFEEQPGTVTITRNGKPVMTVLPYETHKFMLETIDSLREMIKALQDEELMPIFHESVEAIRKGELMDQEDAKREAGL